MVGKDFVKFVLTFPFFAGGYCHETPNNQEQQQQQHWHGWLPWRSVQIPRRNGRLLYETTFTGNKLYKDSDLYPQSPVLGLVSRRQSAPSPAVGHRTLLTEAVHVPPTTIGTSARIRFAVCPFCKKCMNVEMQYIDRAAAGKVVKDEDEKLPDVEGEDEDEDDNNYGMYMVTDDLCLSSTTFITQWRLKTKV